MTFILVLFLTAFYFVIASCLFTQWLELIQQDVCMTRDQRFLSKVLLITATIIWPLVLPFAYIELLLKSKRNRDIEIILNQTNAVLERK